MTTQKYDYKKSDKELYLPKTQPTLIDVTTMNYLTVDGVGDPDHAEYAQAVEVLYALSYTIKMSPKAGQSLAGFFDYVVFPLEGFWWTKHAVIDLTDLGNRDEWLWTSVIRQPDFVTDEALGWAKEQLAHKKPELDTSRAKLQEITEGLCVQAMHIGPYSTEPATIERMREFMRENDLVDETSDIRKHHEIYLSDPRRTAPEKLKTVLRHPVGPA